MKFLIYFTAYFLANYNLLIAQEVECQGAVLRVLNKTTNEKNYFTTPLSQTIEPVSYTHLTLPTSDLV